jgi:type II secretory pathway pseudopilin PulG
MMCGTDIRNRHGCARRAGFTLIEILAVALIIMILAAILLPVFAKARTQAKIRKARAESHELIKAWQAYWTAYTNWPSYGIDFAMTREKVRVLSGEDRGVNPLSIQFMVFTPTARDDGFKDPWGNLYKVGLSKDSASASWTYKTRAYCANREKYLEH